MSLPTEDELVQYLLGEVTTAGRKVRRGCSKETARLAARRCLERAASVSAPPVGSEADTFALGLVREFQAQQPPPEAVGSLFGFIASIFLKAFFSWAVQRLLNRLYPT